MSIETHKIFVVALNAILGSLMIISWIAAPIYIAIAASVLAGVFISKYKTTCKNNQECVEICPWWEKFTK